MGAYLSQPKTDKESSDESNDLLVVGASSMQGWRNSQEDAHNSILNFDTDTSFFAVYDGHGGAEVAAYCADKLPDFLKELDSYKTGEFEKALKEAFLGFDQTLLEPKIVEILKVLAGEKNYTDPEGDEMEEDDDEDLAELHEESHLPLQEVLRKYSDNPLMPQLKKLKEIDAGAGAKPQSPFLRGRRAAAVVADAVNKAEMDPDAHPQGSSTSAAAAAAAAAGPSSSTRAALFKIDSDEPEEDSTVSSSSSSASKSNNINSNSKNAEATANGATISPDSSLVKECEQNGSVTSSEAKANKELVSTTAAAAAEDATVSASSDAADCKQNGNVGSSSSVAVTANALLEAGSISSTSKEAKMLKKSLAGEEDSADEDADYNANEDLANADDDDDDEEAEDDDEDDEEDEDVDEDGEEEELGDEEDDDEDDENDLMAENYCQNVMMEEPGKDSGCTAVVALLHGRDLYVANAGDSRCVVCRAGKAIEMSLDHKPEDEEESLRIVKAGGRVTMDGRVNGGLNLSRALGDHAYKLNNKLSAEEQMISALPDIKKLIITPEDEFMVLACDGIWNFMSSDEVVDFVRKRMTEDKKMSQICEELFDNCLAPNTHGDGTGCDNMTAVIVRFQSKLQQLSSQINPKQTEDMLALKRAIEEEAAAASLQHSLKRIASPTSDAENITQSSKRLKTDAECDNAGKSSSGICETTTTTNTTTKTVAEHNECDSVNAADAAGATTNEALATAATAAGTAAVSST